MTKRTISPSDYQIFLFKSLLILSLAWGSFALALANFFYAWCILAIAIMTGLFLTRHAIKKQISLRPSLEMILASLATLLIVIIFSTFTTPTVFSGRDQGSFSEAAIRLAQNHRLEFSTPVSNEFFKLHQMGLAQNFPGFYYTQNGTLLTQFSLVYTSWLAFFYAIFGLTGLIIANAALMYMFLLSFYLLVRLFLKSTSAIPAMLFTATSFVFMWFSKYTLSENMALPLIWLMILALMLLLKKRRTLHYSVFLLSLFLLCFARIEGFAISFVAIGIIFLDKNTRNYLKQQPLSRIAAPAIIFLAFFIFNAIADRYFYREIIKAVLPSVTLPHAQYLGNLKNNVLPDFYMTKIFYLYGMLGFLVVGVLSIAMKFWKKEFYKLIPFFIVAPTLIYLFDAQISADHPWLLRRFMITLLPAGIFYSGLLIGSWLENSHRGKHARNLKILAGALTVFLLAGNLPSFSKYVFFSEYKGLLEQTQKLGEKFNSNDLVLIDRETTGDGWSMISGPMNSIYGKNVAYFFNTEDLKKLDTEKFENIYLIAPNKQASYYLSSTIGNRLVEVDQYELTFPKISSQQNDPLKKIFLPEKIESQAHGKIFKITK